MGPGVRADVCFVKLEATGPEKTRSSTLRRMHRLIGVPAGTNRGWVGLTRVDADGHPSGVWAVLPHRSGPRGANGLEPVRRLREPAGIGG